MSKPDLVVIVEGQTESAALNDLLAAHLQNHGISVSLFFQEHKCRRYLL